MRVCFLSDRLSLRGGADLHLRQVVEWAVGCGHEVMLVVGRVEKDAVAPLGVTTGVVRGLAGATSSRARLGGLEGFLAEADVVHAQNIMNPVALRCIVATGRAIVTVQDHRVFCPGMGKTMPGGEQCTTPFESADCSHCLPDESYRLASFELTRARRDALRGASLVVLSRYMKRELETAGLGGALVIPPWVKTAALERKEPGEFFLTGGRLVAHKGVLDALDAWGLAGEPLPLEVAGDGALAGSLTGTRQLGWLDHDALQKRLRRARALLFPAFWQEPFGILGIEALSQGTPVIVASRGGTGDWSDQGCLVVEAGAVEQMAEAVRRLAHDPDMAVRLGEEGRAMVGERFSEDRLAPSLEELYSGVAFG